MKEQVTLKAERRSGTGKGAARRLRRDGFVPAVVYGRGEESSPLKVRVEELETLLNRISVDNTLVDLEVDGESRPVLIREVQRHPFRPDLLHVDFFQIHADEKIRVEVPLRLVGHSQGVEEGGILQQSKHDIAVECLPGEIPEYFELDVSALDVGDSLHVGDLSAGGVTLLEDLDTTVCGVVPPTVVQVEEEVEELELEELEPELIGREREEEEGVEEGEEEQSERREPGERGRREERE